MSRFSPINLSKSISNNKAFIKQNLISYIIIIINIISSIICLRQVILSIGKNNYGLWILILMITSILNLLNLGYTSVAVFKYKQYVQLGKLSGFLSSNRLVCTLQILFCAVIAFIIIYFSQSLIHDINYIKTFRILLILSFPGVAFNILSSYLESILFYHFKTIYYKNFLELVRMGLLNVLYVIGLFFFKSVFIIAILFSLVSFIIFVSSIRKYKKFSNLTFINSNNKFDYIKNNFSDGISYWLLGFSAFIIGQTDPFFIQVIIQDLGQVTTYSQSFRLQELAVRFIKKIAETKAPKILSLYNSHDFTAVKDIYKQLLIINLIASVSACILIMIFGKIILTLWLGDVLKFDQHLIVVIGFLCITSSIHWVFWNFCTITEHHKKIRWVILTEIILNLTLSYFLLKQIGIIGLPLASIISNIFTIMYMAKLFFTYNLKYKTNNPLKNRR